ncbi:hypothetical protein [Acinetobacter pittii]|uniref:hypothetical protein n=1 Tax=Acinetobacter pittii TaxID=48296 RepID=UPI001933CD67|nr:hypothetical protein [Acinetobacter pittii]QRF07627.1 hypothetical protein HRJ47_06380 [Acinetobacter pittii]
MMTFIAWITTYSAQIQTLCSLIGLLLAVFALLFAIHQIKIAQAERIFSLKYQVVSETFLMLQNIENMLNKIKLLQGGDLKTSMGSLNPTIKNSAKVLFDSLEEVTSHLEATKSAILSFQKGFSTKKNSITLDKLEHILNSQIKIQETLNSTQHRLNRIELKVSITFINQKK